MVRPIGSQDSQNPISQIISNGQSNGRFPIQLKNDQTDRIIRVTQLVRSEKVLNLLGTNAKADSIQLETVMSTLTDRLKKLEGETGGIWNYFLSFLTGLDKYFSVVKEYVNKVEERDAIAGLIHSLRDSGINLKTSIALKDQEVKVPVSVAPEKQNRIAAAAAKPVIPTSTPASIPSPSIPDAPVSSDKAKLTPSLEPLMGPPAPSGPMPLPPPPPSAKKKVSDPAPALPKFKNEPEEFQLRADLSINPLTAAEKALGGEYVNKMKAILKKVERDLTLLEEMPKTIAVANIDIAIYQTELGAQEAKLLLLQSTSETVELSFDVKDKDGNIKETKKIPFLNDADYAIENAYYQSIKTNKRKKPLPESLKKSHAIANCANRIVELKQDIDTNKRLISDTKKREAEIFAENNMDPKTSISNYRTFISKKESLVRRLDSAINKTSPSKFSAQEKSSLKSTEAPVTETPVKVEDGNKIDRTFYDWPEFLVYTIGDQLAKNSHI